MGLIIFFTYLNGAIIFEVMKKVFSHLLFTSNSMSGKTEISHLPYLKYGLNIPVLKVLWSIVETQKNVIKWRLDGKL